ncbi:MAG: TonB-dependent receptor [Chthoniobacterales bacterium]
MAADEFNLRVNRKALELNLDPRIYGTFAEIGAGQEVARRFFFVGAAAGTVAKTMSAYDMTFSDAIYGPAERYVSRQRLWGMLEHEFNLLRERLDAKIGGEKTFFVFADTVAARSYHTHDESHGWMGIRFQTGPRGPVNEIIIHVRMLDAENIAQQEALGITGVNLIYGAFRLHAEPEKLIGSLLDDLTAQRMEVDMIRFSGPAFAGVDNRLMSLQLVAQGLGRTAMFRADGEVVQPAEELYKRAILVERGSFRPVTHVTFEMLRCALADFAPRGQAAPRGVLTLAEITMENLLSTGDLDPQDFLDRTDILGALGQTVLISNFAEYFRLVDYLALYTKEAIGLALGVPALEQIFLEKYYTGLEGGILEGLGRLFKKNVRIYAYPRQASDGAIITADNFRVEPQLRHLYAYLRENDFIVPVTDYREEILGIKSPQVLEQIRAGDPAWIEAVPGEVARIIRERRLLGCAG